MTRSPALLLLAQRWPMLLQVTLQGHHRHLIDTGSALVGHHPLICMHQVVDWLEAMGTYEVSVDEHPEPAWNLRHKANHYMTGRDGGREIDLRRLALEGMQLYGRIVDVEPGGRLVFGGDLEKNLDSADQTYCRIRRSIDDYIAARGIDAPAEPPYQPVWRPKREPESLELNAAGISNVIWATGFDSDFSWVGLPVFDGRGEPVHHRGVTPVAGAYFLGLPWLHTWGSGRFASVGEDARHNVEHIATRVKRRQREAV